ncbi:MAG: BamA/TamA family outer membrane protein [Bryobacteraceae bacterium]
MLSAWNQEPDDNVNSRYSVESVHISGYQSPRISRSLRGQIDRLIGEKLDSATLSRLAARLRDELHARNVTYKVRRGTIPNHVAVEFEAERTKNEFDMDVHNFVYNSRIGLSGEGDATLRVNGSSFMFGLVDNGDELTERFAGFKARFERQNLGTNRLGFAFEFDSYHTQWAQQTLTALATAGSEAAGTAEVAGIYRIRQNFQPVATVVLAPGLTLGVGVSFERFQTQFPAARFESANAMVNTLRYHRRWDESNVYQQELDAGYSLRAATNALNSDYAYTRHEWDARYAATSGRNSVVVGFLAGVIDGRAPLFERFVLGNSTTLRGWNMFELDPLGGSRVVHGSLEYRYRVLNVFYDTGAVWSQGAAPDRKQSAGVGFRKDCFLLAIAFPLKEGRAEPVLIAGMNF